MGGWPFSVMTLTPDEEQHIQALLRYHGNFSAFCREVLGYKDMTKEHEELCTFLTADGHFKLVLMPRYTFKSCIATIGYALWRLVNNPDLRILIYSDATTKAEGFLTAIKNHVTGLDRTSLFRKYFGAWEVDPKSGVWNQSQIVVKPREKAQAEPTIDTGGIETSKVGMHYDLIIFDDIVSDKNVTTPEQMEKVHECYKKALSLLKPGGDVVMVGTRWHFGDLYGRLFAENLSTHLFATHLRKAEVDGEYPFASIGLDQTFLAQQKQQQGSYVFSCLYQNEPVDDDTAIFKSSDFRFYTNRPENLFITCCIDPAISEAAAADDTAITVVGTDAELNMYVLEIVAGHLLPDQLMNEVFSLHQHWGFRILGLETNAFQKMLRKELERRFAYERTHNPNFKFFQVEEFTGSSANSKDLRIRGLQPYHERGALRLPGERLELLTGPYQKLALQMMQFPHSQHDDVLDSLAYHVPIHRAGSTTIPTTEIPYSSAAWFEREQHKKLVQEIQRRPRWRRAPLPQLTFS